MMHPRFQKARTVELRGRTGAVRVVVAESFRLRLLGLMRLRADEIEPILFPRCRSIHLHRMRTPIDLVWLEIGEGGARVLDVIEAIEPGRHGRAPKNASRRATAALELPPGDAERLGLLVDLTVTLTG